ncbi:O-antigen ligase family protein [Singulisphaera sp. PoT]|uniref:O-antigen ligase family protein n=1 Tax=Singulisphaera sp. PoT TaxID=3411797 RepID=UPI003BF5460A
MGFTLFILVNAILFIRPAELVPAMAGLPIYNILISASLAVSFSKVTGQLSSNSLRDNPINACVLGLLISIILSHLTHFSFSAAKEGGVEFAKVLLYYLLLVSVVDTPTRFLRFLRLLAGFTVVLTVLALLQYHGVINIPSLQSIADLEVDASGNNFSVLRLCSTGIYNDPNDLCMILLVGMAICLFGMGDKKIGPLRFFWVLPLMMFGYALTKTHSRGGFLAMLAAMMVLFLARFGTRKAVPLLVIALPAVFVVFAGRQTNISTEGDTGQDRIQLWSSGLLLFRQSPLFGIGQNRYADEVGLVAHNSFVHAFTELGILGGTLFTGLFYYSLGTLHRLGSYRNWIRDPEIRRFRPYLMAIVAAYGTGLLTISRNYIVPTYMIFGIVTVYLRLATDGSPVVPRRFGSNLVGHFAMISIAFVVSAYLFIRMFARYGS